MIHQEKDARSMVSLGLVVILNLYFWILFSVVTFALFFLALPCIFLFDLFVRNRRKTRWLIRRCISRYGGTVVKCGWPLVRVKFVDLSPDEQPPFVFVANHRSTSDGFLMSVLPFECIQILNNWPYKVPGIGLMAKLGEYLKIRQMPFEEFLSKATSLLKANVCIIAFPEGTRSGSTHMGPFHGAAFRLAQQAGVKIVPIAISGNEYIPLRGSLIMHPGRITISKLPALTPDQFRDWSPYRLKTTVRDTIQKHLEANPY
jgi:1-acyl-sn-glycerol-3-phosphate acyltransferase